MALEDDSRGDHLHFGIGFACSETKSKKFSEVRCPIPGMPFVVVLNSTVEF